MAAGGRVFVSVSLALAFSFNLPVFVSSPPPPRWRFAGGVFSVGCLCMVSVFPITTFLCVVPAFIAKPFRGMGVVFEEPHLRLVFFQDFPDFPTLLHIKNGGNVSVPIKHVNNRLT